ncbi:MAG TPA: hypothetical protein VN238_13260 [Solirubrobacteraceae bacterium]|nr:hypothetical protein [Solirubrobacteraceae bacterium]
MIWNMAYEREVLGLGERVVDFPRYRTLGSPAEYLAHKFRPILYFDENEHWRPLNVDKMLAQPGHRVCDPIGCGPVSSLATMTASATPSAGAWLDIAGAGEEGAYHSPDPACNAEPLRDCDEGISAIYYDSTKVSPASYRYFNYWFFYRFNDAPDIADPLTSDHLDHEGDWENVAVAVDDRLGVAAQSFAFVNFGQHGHHFNYLRENLSCDADGEDSVCGPTAQRVHAYPAEGTHATYPDICTRLTLICGQNGTAVPENQHGGERRWARNETASALQKLPGETPAGTPWANGPRSWVDWPGRWGASGPNGGGSPASPGNQSTFDTPWDARCADDNESTSCAVTARAPRPTATPGAVAASAKRCEAWFGPSVRAAVCSPSELAVAVSRRQLGRRGDVAVRVVRARSNKATAVRDRSATVPGLAQLGGEPLRVGDRLLVEGDLAADAMLLVRAADGSHLVDTKFSAEKLRGGRIEIRVTKQLAGARAASRSAERRGPRVVASTAAGVASPARRVVRKLR